MRPRLRTAAAALLALGFAPMLPAGGNTTFDVEVNMSELGSSAYFMSSFNPPAANVGLTGSGNPNPSLALKIGTRYRFNYAQPVAHPFAFMNRGATFVDDTVVLRQVGGEPGGSFEDPVAHPEVDWFDDQTDDMYFTLSNTLAEELLTGTGVGAGYRCDIHITSMRGPITFAPVDTSTVWPAGIEHFENAVIGANVFDAFAQWIPANPNGSYTIVVGDTPAGLTGQVPSSTRWMTVTDTDTAASNRIYGPTVTNPGPTGVGTGQYSWFMNVESFVGTGGVRVVTQHNSGSGYQNVAGLEITSTGVSVIIMGNDLAGIGTAGPSLRTPLYLFADSGGFSSTDWVGVNYTIDYDANEVRAEALGSDGSTNPTATLTGLDIQTATTPNLNEFRWCVRNNDNTVTSTIHYDVVTFSGTNAAPTAASNWTMY